MTPDANDLCVFAVKRGYIIGRFDVQNLKYNSNILNNNQEKVALGSLTSEEPCYGTSATAIERTDESQPKYIRITDFDDFGIEKNHTFVTAENYAEKHILKKGDILFARTGATVGKTFYYDGSIGKAVFAGYCIRFRFDEKLVLPKFAYWCTKTTEFSNWAKGIQRPSGQPNINKEEYKSFEIVLPDFKKQKELCTQLDNAETNRNNKLHQADEYVEQSKSQIVKEIGVAFKEYQPSCFSRVTRKQISDIGIFCNPRSAYLNSLFEELRKNPMCVGTLEEYVDVNPTIKRNNLTDKTQVSFVPMPNVPEKENHAEYSLRDYSEVKTGFTAFQKDDLLWAKITPCMQNGKSFIAADMPTQYGFGSTEFHVLRAKNSKIYMPYLWVMLSEEHVLDAAQGMFCGSAGQQRVPEIFLKKFPLILPEYEKQVELANAVLKALKTARFMRQEAEQEWSAAKAQFEKELLGE